MQCSFCAQTQTYSTYKSCNTAKGLVGIAPNGFLMYVSRHYGGNILDKAMTQDCGLIELLEQGDDVKEFDIQHLLSPMKAIVNIPPLLHIDACTRLLGSDI